MKKKTKKKKQPDGILDIKAYLESRLINRNREINGLLVALLSRSHCLLLGPPGTGKSYLVKLLSTCFENAEYFDILLTKFSLPEDVFGPLDLTALRAGEYKRCIDGYLPTADVAFLDEIFKSNSSILNALLRIINEREYKDGLDSIECSLQMVVGASNELPENAELDALYDRFLLRYWLDYIAHDDDIRQLLTMSSANETSPPVITLDDLEAEQDRVHAVPIPDDIISTIICAKRALEHENYYASDRRWKALLPIVQAQAYLNQHTVVEDTDCLILADCLWKEPRDRTVITQIITKTINPAIYQAQEIVDIATETFQKIPFDATQTRGREGEIFQQIVQANTQFKQNIKKLKALCNLSKYRQNTQLAEMIETIEDYIDQSSRYAAKLSGIN